MYQILREANTAFIDIKNLKRLEIMLNFYDNINILNELFNKFRRLSECSQ